MRLDANMTRNGRFSGVFRTGLSLVAVMMTVGTVHSQGLASFRSANLRVVKTARPASNGFLFIDGRYISPPYTVRMDGDSIIINDREFTAKDFDLSRYQDEIDQTNAEMFGPETQDRRRQHNRFGRRWARSESREHSTPLALLNDALQTAVGNDVVVLCVNRAPLFLPESREGQDLIAILAKSERPGNRPLAVPAVLKTEAERESWTGLVSEFEATPDFLARAAVHVSKLETVQIENERAAATSIWIDRVGYPLTIFAMIVVVLAFGHLLSNKPCIESIPKDGAVSPETRRAVGRSLLIVGLLSIIDLVWTIAAANTTSMRELNPLGSQLIDNPAQLILFKTAVTSIAIGLLYWLHRLPMAQIASWWSCLVLTLLTARWLTFHSMFL